MDISYLDVFRDWSERRMSQIKSEKQYRFFNYRLGRAVKEHEAAGLPVHDTTSRNCKCFAFYLDADADVMVDTNYIMIELYGPNARLNRMRLVVNYGDEAAINLGYEWRNRWVRRVLA